MSDSDHDEREEKPSQTPQRPHPQVGDVIPMCMVIAQNRYYYFLMEQDKGMMFYDIVMPIWGDGLHLQIGDQNVDVKVYSVHVADNGTPGIFVLPVKKIPLFIRDPTRPVEIRQIHVERKQ